MIIVLTFRLLHVQNGYCRFEEAEHTYNQAMVLVKQLQGMGASPNLASLYSEFSTLYMLRSNYAEVSQSVENRGKVSLNTSRTQLEQ